MTSIPDTRYALNGQIHLAYQVLGEGLPTLVGVNAGPGSHMDHQWTEPHAARWLHGFAEFCRLVMYDNRGVGLSDPVSADAVPTMDEQVDDLRAIMDTVGVDRAVISGHLAGCAPALVFAASHPERVEGLVLIGGYARLRRDDDYPVGVDQEMVDQIAAMVLAGWGSGEDIAVMEPSMAADDEFRGWYARMERMAASPGTAAAMARQWFDIDVRSVLPSIDRFLGTVLFVDVIESTQLAVEIGDAQFRNLIQEFHQLLRRQLERYHGRLVDTAGDGALMLFDSPARAITCAQSINEGVRALGIQVRAGVHTGEMEHGPEGEIRGIAVHIGARVAALAGGGEIYVSRTIRDLMAGSPVRFDKRGLRTLKGVPGRWETFAVIP